MTTQLTQERVIEQFKQVHGEKYTYGKFVYVDAKTKAIITCRIHGDFSQIPDSHKHGNGCKQCGILSAAKKQSRTLQDFLNRSIEIHHDKYDYSLVEYVNDGTKVKIKCLTCYKIFNQTPNKHLAGNGCKNCAQQYLASIYKKSLEDFVKEAREIHHDKYDYSLVEYVNEKNKVKIKCLDCNLLEIIYLVRVVQNVKKVMERDIFPIS